MRGTFEGFSLSNRLLLIPAISFIVNNFLQILDKFLTEEKVGPNKDAKGRKTSHEAFLTDPDTKGKYLLALLLLALWKKKLIQEELQSRRKQMQGNCQNWRRERKRLICTKREWYYYGFSDSHFSRLPSHFLFADFLLSLTRVTSLIAKIALSALKSKLHKSRRRSQNLSPGLPLTPSVGNEQLSTSSSSVPGRKTHTTSAPY